MQTAHAIASQVELRGKRQLDLINSKFTALPTSAGYVPHGGTAGQKIAALAAQRDFHPFNDIKRVKAEVYATFDKLAAEIAAAREYGGKLADAAAFLRNKGVLPDLDSSLKAALVAINRAGQTGAADPKTVADAIERDAMTGLSALDLAAKQLVKLRSTAKVALSRQVAQHVERLAKSARDAEERMRWERVIPLFRRKHEFARLEHLAAHGDHKGARRMAEKQGRAGQPSPFGQRGGKRISR